MPSKLMIEEAREPTTVDLALATFAPCPNIRHATASVHPTIMPPSSPRSRDELHRLMLVNQAAILAAMNKIKEGAIRQTALSNACVAKAQIAIVEADLKLVDFKLDAAGAAYKADLAATASKKPVPVVAPADHPNPTDYSLAQAERQRAKEQRDLQRVQDGSLSVAQVAVMTGFCKTTITTMFKDEKGVLKISRPETLHKRGYQSIRIPHKVYERVIHSIAN